MKLLVLGASRGTGAECVKVALARGQEVTAFARSPDKLDIVNPKLTKRAGDFHQRESVTAAIPGHDAVIVTASASSLKAFKDEPKYFSRGTGYAIEGMKAHGVRRLVILSAFGTGDSRALANFLVDKLLIGFVLKQAFEDHVRQEALVRESGLDWVIARPGRLTNGPPRGKYVKKVGERVPSSISRADLADFLVSATEGTEWVGKAVHLGG